MGGILLERDRTFASDEILIKIISVVGRTGWCGDELLPCATLEQSIIPDDAIVATFSRPTAQRSLSG